MTSPPELQASFCGVAALLELSAQCRRAALASGALQPIQTEATTVSADGLRFSLRWVSSLARKDAVRAAPAGSRPLAANPFLPPAAALTVAALGDEHLLLLNKFPVIDNHLLLVTRSFVAQTAPLTLADWRALLAVVGAHGGLGFYNGGAAAGASQAHKHLQWVPDASFGEGSGLPAFFARAAATASPAHAAVLEDSRLPWRHAFVRIDLRADEDCASAAARVHAAFLAAWEHLGLPPPTAPMPPYNVLADRHCLLLVPRRCESWEGISVNALGYAGSLFARERARIDALRQLGPLALLGAVGWPREP